MNIADLISPDRVFFGLKAADKSRLLAELSRRAASAAGLPPQDIQRALEAREALGSTGVGAGVAIPHARFPGIDRFIGLFARLERRVDFYAVDDQPVDLVFLLLVPTDAAGEHLKALACVSRRLRAPDGAAGLRRATDAEELYAALVGDLASVPRTP
jgi:nitrogen PTS system EIIA component